MDVNEMMGRTLGDVLESRGNDETLCFIGSASSYFCIGTLQEIDGMIDGISESYRKEYTDTDVYPKWVRIMMADGNIVTYCTDGGNTMQPAFYKGKTAEELE